LIGFQDVRSDWPTTGAAALTEILQHRDDEGDAEEREHDRARRRLVRRRLATRLVRALARAVGARGRPRVGAPREDGRDAVHRGGDRLVVLLLLGEDRDVVAHDRVDHLVAERLHEGAAARERAVLGGRDHEQDAALGGVALEPLADQLVAKGKGVRLELELPQRGHLKPVAGLGLERAQRVADGLLGRLVEHASVVDHVGGRRPSGEEVELVRARGERRGGEERGGGGGGRAARDARGERRRRGGGGLRRGLRAARGGGTGGAGGAGGAGGGRRRVRGCAKRADRRHLSCLHRASAA
jgi:hypothetical protein